MRQGQLKLEVENIQQPEGIIWVGIYQQDNYLVKEQAIIKGVNVTQTGKLEVVIDSLPYATYAIALFHDINENGELDRNFLGIPSEPYAFSAPPRSKWRLPRFDEIAFHFNRPIDQMKARLQHW